METNFSISVHIELGISEEFKALLVSFMDGMHKTNDVRKALDSTVSEKDNVPTWKGETLPEKGNTDTSEKLTAEDVRSAMNRTRQRIEGKDFKDNTESEGYRKYHKLLTATFKNIAAELGSDKPSALPEDRIGDFVRECDSLQILGDGTVGKPLPF